MSKYTWLLIILLVLVSTTNQNNVTLSFQELFGGDIIVYGVGISVNKTTFLINDKGVYNASITLYCNNSGFNNYVKITLRINNESVETVFETTPIKLSVKVYLSYNNSIEVIIYKLGTGFFSILSNSTLMLTKIIQGSAPENGAVKKSFLLEMAAILSILTPIIIRIIQVKKKRGV